MRSSDCGVWREVFKFAHHKSLLGGHFSLQTAKGQRNTYGSVTFFEIFEIATSYSSGFTLSGLREERRGDQ
jgi:hypothetical protein